ncbi:MAG: sigma-70 family RNA polymerase sigma factor [Verrucomicrobiales bacterium]|nr:sigma-70 family RNA polymerase sigma factor [Verrucomicrobiales bacterium]
MDDSRHEYFLRRFTSSEPALRIFVRSLVPTVGDADDVLQEVAITLWKKFGEFPGETEEEFRAWSFTVAKFKVLSWRRDQGRERLVFGDDTISLLAQESEARSGKLSAQREALKTCLAKLSPEQRSLVESAYDGGTKIEKLARSLERTAMSVYKQLHRLRIALAKCARVELQKEGWQ